MKESLDYYTQHVTYAFASNESKLKEGIGSNTVKYVTKLAWDNLPCAPTKNYESSLEKAIMRAVQFHYEYVVEQLEESDGKTRVSIIKEEIWFILAVRVGKCTLVTG